MQRVSYRLGEHHGIGDWWELNAACLDALIAKARSRGVPVLLVYVPPHKSWRAFPALEEFASTREPRVPLVDLGSRWPGPPEGGFYESDGHLRVEGHRLVAEELVATIRREWPEVAAD